ncbi:hypothetical protein HZS61_009374 [Fusarium oxysporum f. sp. conglutinans]|uniref:Uncharacterized protein n=1 Tax=Fusarium oxysporum f. sp. conglutinans TaxID=100902 RepID=A0A8H6GZG7_FUSOX|nr:hypothetical protein HZS61_009374 [Fusarium oxysporum f. sp. conglutinans]
MPCSDRLWSPSTLVDTLHAQWCTVDSGAFWGSGSPGLVFCSGCLSSGLHRASCCNDLRALRVVPAVRFAAVVELVNVSVVDPSTPSPPTPKFHLERTG